jgi:hypothetical protein
MKSKKRRPAGAHLKKKKVPKYNDGGRPTNVTELLTYLNQYQAPSTMVPTSDPYNLPVAQVNLPEAVVETDRSEPTYVNAMLPERIAMTEGDLAAVYQNLGSQGVTDYLDMTQGVIDAQNRGYEAIEPFLYLTPFGTPALINRILADGVDTDDLPSMVALASSAAMRKMPKGPAVGGVLRQGAEDVRNFFRRMTGKPPKYTARTSDIVGQPGRMASEMERIATGLTPEGARRMDMLRRRPSSSGMFSAAEEAALEAEILGGEASVLGQRGLPSGVSVVRRANPKRARATEVNDLVYRAGDLERVPPDTQVGMMSGSRSTGHFGTGFYFYGDEREAISHANQSNRPDNIRGVVSVVNTSDYNLAPGSRELHDALREVNSYGEFSSRGHDRITAWDFERVLDVLGRYDEFFDYVGDYEGSYAKGQELAQKANEMLNKPGNIDSRSTIVMKLLGYDGVNAVGTPMDKYAYGTVIYDIKPESVRDADWLLDLSKPKGPGAEGVDPVQPRPDTVYGTHGKNLRDGNEPAWRVLSKQPSVSAAQLQADYGSNILPQDADAAAVVRYNEAQEYQRNIIMAHGEVYGGGRERSNVSQLPVLMHGSKLEKAIDKNGYISVSQIQQLIDKGQMSQPEAEALQSALETAILNEKAKVVTEQMGEEAFAVAEESPSAFFERKKLLDAVDVKKVSWNNLKRLAVRSGSPYDIVQHPVGERPDGSVRANHYQTMGIDRLYENAETGSAVYQLDPIYQTAKTTTITTTNPILQNVGRHHFGANALAHYRSFRRPDEPEILYITEVQADPLQARPDEFPDELGTGQTKVTRQVGLPGARRYNDPSFRNFQVIAAENVDYSVGQLQKEFLKIYDILKTPGNAHRLSAIRTLQNQIYAHSDSFNSFDNAMLDQMMNDPSLNKPWYRGGGGGPSWVDFSQSSGRSQSTDVNRMVRDIIYKLEDLISKIDESPSWQKHRSGERPVTDNPDWVKGFEMMEAELAQKLEEAREIFNGVGDNVYFYKQALQEGYNGKLTPLQAKLVKNQDQFVVGKILEAESSGALHIRFPKGETAGRIQGYETIEDQRAMVQMSIDNNLYNIEVSKSSMIDTYGSEVFQWAPSNQGKSLENMSEEEFLVWWDGVENNEPAYKEMQRQAEDIATREVERKLIAVKRQLRDMGINPRRHGELDNISDIELAQIFSDNNLVVGRRPTSESPVYRQLVAEGITGDAQDAVIRLRAQRIENAWGDLATKITEINTERAHLQSIQQEGNDEAHQAIMDGYDALTKAFKKHKLTYREVTDEYGNAWYEVDVPANLNMNAGEVRSYKRGGRVGMRVKKKSPFKIVKR